MHPTSPHRRQPWRRVWPAVLAAFTLTACGGGGDDDADEPRGASVSALTFSQAPSLPVAATPLPVENSRNVCRGVRVDDRDIENLQVPDGALCVLDAGVRIGGNLELGDRSQLFARGIVVGGNVQGQRTGIVVIEASTVAGSVQLDNGGTVALRTMAIGGSIQLVDHSGDIVLDANRVDSDIQLFDNQGGAALTDNRADGNLQCKQNQPAPTGSGNTAASKEDQCAAL